MKTILAISNSGAKGKSTTVLELAQLLLSNYQNHLIIETSKNPNHLTIDFRLVLEINGKKVALESQGDPNTNLKNRLIDIEKRHQPDVLICTSRTRGETVSAIKEVANQFGYDTIWTSTYDIHHSHQQVNLLKAQHLLDFLVQMNLI